MNQTNRQVNWTTIGLLGVLVASLLLCSCAPVQTEPAAKDPLPAKTEASELEYTTTYTARGVEVEVPLLLAEDQALLIVALQEIDNNGVHVHLPGWRVRILPSDSDKEGLREKHKLIKVRWRYDDDPLKSLLPGLWDLVQGVR